MLWRQCRDRQKCFRDDEWNCPCRVLFVNVLMFVEVLYSMNDKIQILTLALDCDSAIALVQLCLIEKGLYAKHAFELTSACATFTDQYCPHQPDQSCNCQVITLQIYGRDLSPVSLVFHSHDSSTEIFYG